MSPDAPAAARPRRPARGEGGGPDGDGLSWQEGSLRQVIAALPGFGEEPAILTLKGDRESTLSYRELSDRVGRLTAGLMARGVGAGQRVAVLAPNSPDWIVSCLAIVNAGGVAVPLDAALDDESLGHVLADSEPALVFAEEEYRGRIRRLAAHEFESIALDGDPDGAAEWQGLLAHAPADPPDLAPEDPAVIFYTSGTTGPPKGVPLSHRNLLFELHGLQRVGLMSPGERLLLPLPLHHVYPFVVGMLAPLVYGVGIVLPQSMTGPHILQAMRACDVATVLGVPRLYEAMMSNIAGRLASGHWAARLLFHGLRRTSLFARRRLSLRIGACLFGPLRRQVGPRLRLLASGGAALDPELAWNLESLGWTVATGYGLTETAPMLSMVPPGNTHFDTAGRPIPGVEVRIAPLAERAEEDAGESDDEETNSPSEAGPPAREIGEIQAKGPNVFAGYLNLPERTAEAFTEDGWFRTEDRGWIDTDGYLHVLGRAATFVVTPAGKNISLEDLERAYERHPLIGEIGIFMRERALAAVAVPDARELRKAAAERPQDAVHDAVREHSQRLPRYKRIDDLVVSREALSRTRLGKIRRDKLRQRFDSIRAGKETGGEKAGPMAIDEMSGEDQALMEHAEAREVWNRLAEKYPSIRLSPDSDVSLDLGIDSLEWINVTLEIRERTGIELSEAATARIHTVRDLLREVLDHADEAREQAADLEKAPERFLTPEQERWLKPLGRVEAALAWLLYHVNRILVRAVFKLKVSGLEHLRSSGPVVLAPNHASVLDPFVIAAALPYDFLRRSGFAGWTGMAFANPVYRLVARLARTLPVRHDRAAFSSLALALVMLRRGANLIWFPEGRRSPDGRLQPFRPGIGVLLATHPRPVVPAILSGTFDAMPTGQRLPRPRRVEIRFGRACRPEELEASGRGDGAEARMTDGLRRRMEDLQGQSRA